MNSDMGLVWVRAAFEADDREIFAHEVLVHSEDLRSFADQIMRLLAGDEDDARIGGASPELILTVKRYRAPAEWDELPPVPMPEPEPDSESLELLIAIDTGIAAGIGVWGSGPAMLLNVPASAIRAFGRDLRSETELGLLL
jgi:hypothetical protein